MARVASSVCLLKVGSLEQGRLDAGCRGDTSSTVSWQRKQRMALAAFIEWSMIPQKGLLSQVRILGSHISNRSALVYSVPRLLWVGSRYMVFGQAYFC